MKRICFFAQVPNREDLERVGFYAQDLRVLRELADEVVIAIRPQEIPLHCDLYFAWWWSRAVFPIAAARVSGVPAVVTGVFDYDTPPLEAGAAYVVRPSWHQLVMRFGLENADANVFISKYETRRVPEVLRVRNPRYVQLSVDSTHYAEGTGAREPFIFNVAWSGGLNAKRKCLFEIVRAMPLVLAQHPGVRLVMAGKQGEAHQELVREAEALGVLHAIDFLGVISEEKKVDLMQRCAVYLSPTLFEGFGLGIAEAMACGAAVVSSPEGSITEVVADAGLLVDGRSPERIAEATSRLLADPALARDLGRRARAHVVGEYPYRARRDGLVRVIEEALARNRTRGRVAAAASGSLGLLRDTARTLAGRAPV